jgi:hypothetical protein
MFVLILFFAYGFYTIKPIKDLTLLGREQTEEWKGWMQFIFLLYHYFHAEEVIFLNCDNVFDYCGRKLSFLLIIAFL